MQRSPYFSPSFLPLPSRCSCMCLFSEIWALPLPRSRLPLGFRTNKPRSRWNCTAGDRHHVIIDPLLLCSVIGTASQRIELFDFWHLTIFTFAKVLFSASVCLSISRITPKKVTKEFWWHFWRWDVRLATNRSI